MHKYRLLTGLFLFILALCVCGCSGSGSSADPMGTGTVQFVSEFSTPIATGGTAPSTVISAVTVQPNSSLTLTVWVSNYTSDGRLVPVINEKINFSLDSPENGARLNVLNDRTAGNGQARVVYSAGNNLFSDVVRVTTGVGATASILITKTGTTTRGSVVALSASQNPVAPLGFSTITATVTDGGFPVQGERVTLALLTNNGATLSVLNGLTNAGGQVSTTYQAGNNQNQDVIQATLANGATAQVTMSKVGGLRGVVVALATSQNPVAPLGFSTITATVTDNGLAVQGERVTFALTTNNAGSLSIQSALTNASGQVMTTYQAGNNQNEDVIRATLTNGAAALVTMTKSTGIRGLVIALAPTSPISVAPLGYSTITATVTDNGVAIPGERVTFALTTDNEGSLSVLSGLTSANGQVMTTYQAGNNNKQDVVQASLSNGASAMVVITKTGVGPGTSIVLASNPVAPLAPARFAVITATVRDSGNNLVSGALVRFSMTTANGSISRNELQTDGNGVASIIYYAWNNLATDIVQATTDDGGFTQIVLTKSGQVIGFTATMIANPLTFTKGAGSGPWICNSILTVTVVDNNNLPARGLRVRFNPLFDDAGGILIIPASGVSTPSNALTGVDGKVVASFRGELYTGTFVVTGYVDINDNGVQDPTEPTVAATLTVTD